MSLLNRVRIHDLRHSHASPAQQRSRAGLENRRMSPISATMPAARLRAEPDLVRAGRHGLRTPGPDWIGGIRTP